MTSRARSEKWRNIIGFSLVLAMNPMLPLPLLVIGLIDLLREFDQPTCSNYTVLSGISTLKTRLQQYRMLNGSLPTTEEGLQALINAPAGSRHQRQLITPAQLLDPWDHPYQYQKGMSFKDKPFEVWSMGPDGLDGTADDVHDD